MSTGQPDVTATTPGRGADPAAAADDAAGSAESLVSRVADEYVGRLARGERPTVGEYARRHPAIAAVLREVLPALELLRGGPGTGAAPSPSSPPPATGRPAAAEVPPGEIPSAVPGAARGTIGDFRILREAGRGGMGVVYEAEQVSLGRRVALKVLPFAAAMDARHLQRFRHEAQAAALLHHTNIVPVFGVGCDRGVHYYAMQFIEGPTLAAVVADLRRAAGLPADPEDEEGPAEATPAAAGREPGPRRTPVAAAAADETVADDPAAAAAEAVAGSSALCAGVSAPLGGGPAHTAFSSTANGTRGAAFFRTVAQLGIQAAEALEHAHQFGIVHRDVKPANLLVDARGNLWVTDFGLARVRADTRLTMSGDLLGTVRYMSPEQALARRAVVDHRTDVYSLGATLYELLTLRPAYAGRDRNELLRRIAFEEPRPPRRVNPAVPRELDTIVGKAMAKNPAERYATAAELAEDLRRFLEDRPIRAKRPTPAQRARKWARRHRPLVASLGVSAVLLVVGAVVGSALYGLKQRQLATERAGFAQEKERERQRTAQSLYRTLLGRAEALRLAREPGYRARVWRDLREAAALDVPERDLNEVRREVIACLGDPVGLDPVALPAAARAAPVPAPEPFRTFLESRRHEHSVPVHAVTRNGQMLAFRDGPGVSLRDREGKTLARAGLPLGHAYDMEFTPDGTLLIAAGEEGVAVWEVPGLTPRTFFRAGNVFSVAAHPGGRLFAAAGRRVELWSLHSNRPVASLAAPGGRAGVEFTPDGTYLLAVDGNRVASAWAVSHTPEKLHLAGHAGGVPGVAFSPDGTRVASVSKDRTARVWDAASGALLHTCAGHEHVVETVAFSPDGALLATGALGGVIRLWDPASGKELAKINSTGNVWRLQFDPGGRYLAAAGDFGVVAWAVTPGARGADVVAAEPFLALRGTYACDLALHPTGSALAYMERHGPLSGRVWAYDLEKDATPRVLGRLGKTELRTLHFDPAGTALRFLNGAGAIALWQWQDGPAKPVSHPINGFQLSGSPDGRWAATASPSDRVTIYDVRADRPWLTLPSEGVEVWSTAWSPDGNRLAVGLSDGGLAVWDLAQVRARLAEFGIPVDSTATDRTVARSTLLSDADFRRIVKRQADLRPRPQEQVMQVGTTADKTETEESLTARALIHAVLGESEKAAADSAQALRAGDSKPAVWHTHALVSLAAGDAEGYRTTCAAMVERLAAGTDDWQLANRLAWVCSLAPGALADANEPVRLAAQALARTDRLGQGQLGSVTHTYGAALYRAGRFREAVEQLERSAELHGDGGTAWDHLFLAMAHGRLGRGDEAGRRLRQATGSIEHALEQNLRGNTPAALVLRYDHLLELRVLTREAERLVAGGAGDDGRPPPQVAPWVRHVERSWAFAYLGDRQQQLAELTRATDRHPRSPSLWYARGVVHADLGQWQAAAADFSKVLELKPDDHDVFNRRGVARGRLGQKDAAIADVSRAIDLAPDVTLYWMNRGTAYRDQNLPDKAEADFLKAGEAADDDAESWSALAERFAELKRTDHALRAHGRVIELRPDDWQARRSRGLAYMGLKQWGQAAADFAKEVELNPTAWEGWKNLAEAHVVQEHWETASAHFQKALELGADDGVTWSKHALVRFWLGDEPGYRKACRTMLERFGTADVDPSSAKGTPWERLDAATRTARACALADGGMADPAKVVELAERLRRGTPNHHMAERTLGLALLRAGRPQEGLEHLRRLDDSFAGSYLPVRLPLAIAHHRVGQIAEARQCLEQAAQKMDREMSAPRRDAKGEISWWANTASDERLILLALRREAEALIRGTPWPPAGPGPTQPATGRSGNAAGDPATGAEPSPTSWLGWKDRAEAHAALGQWEQAAAGYDRALELAAPAGKGWYSRWGLLCDELARRDELFERVASRRPDAAEMGVERARHHLLRGRWPTAAEHYAKALNNSPAADPHFEMGCARLLAGDADGYRRLCADLARRAGEKPTPSEAFVLARTCAIGGASGVDPAAAVRWGEAAVAARRSAWYLSALGMAHYRAGQYEQAVARLEESNRLGWNQVADAQNWLLLAMCHHRLGDRERAGEALSRAVELTRLASPNVAGGPARALPPDWAGIELLRREAEALVPVGPVTPPAARGPAATRPATQPAIQPATRPAVRGAATTAPAR